MFWLGFFFVKTKIILINFRQIPLISINTSNLIQKCAKQFRDSNLFTKILELTPNIIYNSYPYSMKDTVSIELIFQSYLTFFEVINFFFIFSQIFFFFRLMGIEERGQMSLKPVYYAY